MVVPGLTAGNHNLAFLLHYFAVAQKREPSALPVIDLAGDARMASAMNDDPIEPEGQPLAILERLLDAIAV